MVQTFKQTSDALYDRHVYKLIFKDRDPLYCNDYEYLRAFWYHYRDALVSVEVIDKP